MKKLFTNRVQLNGITIVLFSLSLILSACSASDKNLSSTNGEGVETITIQNDEGETVIKMRDDEVLSVEKNGEGLSKEERDAFLKELESKPGFFSQYDVHPKFNFNNFKDEMKKFKGECKQGNFSFNFDNEKFQEGMKKLHDELDSMKFHKFEFNFDNEEFQDQMKQLESNLQNIKIDIPEINIDFDEDELEAGLSEMMENLNDEMENLDFNMDELNKELNKFNEFIKNVKSEMVKDGLLNSEVEDINIDFDSDELKINGKPIPEELKEKYKRMYEEHFSKELDGDYHFHFNE